MTEKEILDGNILIADFMGWQSYWLHGGKKGNTVCPSMDRLYGYILPKGLTQKTMNDEPFENVEYLRFHTSWDWLMPVVEKIKNTLSEAEHKCNFEPESALFDYQLFIESGHDTIRHLIIWARISVVYAYVLEFIKWYNENKQL